MPLSLPPLYEALRRAAEATFQANTVPPQANPGLIWERYPRIWSGTDLGKAKDRQPFLREFAEQFARAQDLPRLQAQHARMGAFAAREFTSYTPFVTGLGAEHPSENGFTFDRQLGVPFLPGSSLKGLARAVAAMLANEDPRVAEQSRALLGSPPPDRQDNDKTQPGTVIFYGGWPVTWPQLQVALISPHHPEYQKEQDKRSPKKVAAYTEEPNPVAFLAVAPGAQFRIYLGTTPRASADRTPVDLTPVWEWLTLGLELLGIGGKTAAGFGRMHLTGTTTVKLPAPPPAPADTVLVALSAPVGGRPVAVDAQEAMAQVRGAGPTVRLDLTRTGDLGDTWAADLAQLRATRDQVTARLREIPSASVVIAALAPQPLLIALGLLIGDMVKVEALHKRRSQPWGWAPSRPSDAKLQLRPPASGGDAVALLINVSGRNSVETLPPGGWRCWEITVDQPSPTVIQSRAQRDQFRDLARAALAEMAAQAPAAIHVFPAMPAAFAVELGLLYLPRGWPPLHVWDRQDGQWVGPFVVPAG